MQATLRNWIGFGRRNGTVLAGIALAVAAWLQIGTLAIGDEGLPEGADKLPTTHRQTATIKLDATSGPKTLADFCVGPKGEVLALVSKQQAAASGVAGVLQALAGGSTENTPAGCEVQVYDRDGKLLRSWTVGFAGQAINTGPDGTIYVGGNGHLARYDGEGKLLAEADAPQSEAIRNNPDELKRLAAEQLEAERASADEQIKNFDDQKKQLSEKDAKDRTEEEKQYLATIDQQVQIYKTYGDSLKKKTVEQAMAEITAGAMMINSICAGERDAFVVCRGTKGYGYSVWRTDLEFKNPQQIVKDLSGCCGQMDVQCYHDELWVAENSRKRVVRYDREGKSLASFGKADREGLGEGFGSCCNPMNSCFTADGELYLAESNGMVKHFTPDGKFVGIVGIAKVPAGCKNSAIGVSPDGERLYYIDIQRSEIIILAKHDPAASAAN